MFLNNAFKSFGAICSINSQAQITSNLSGSSNNVTSNGLDASAVNKFLLWYRGQLAR